MEVEDPIEPTDVEVFDSAYLDAVTVVVRIFHHFYHPQSRKSLPGRDSLGGKRNSGKKQTGD